jgi:hypothetical protein
VAVVPPPDPAQVHDQGPAPETAEAVPAEHRLVVGATDTVVPLALPQVPLTGGGGAALTVTVAFWAALPPAPVHVRMYDVVALGVTDCVPLVALDPVQPLLAVHEVLLVELQVSVADPPAVMVAGAALIETVGVAAAAFTVTVVFCAAEPPAPVQVRV